MISFTSTREINDTTQELALNKSLLEFRRQKGQTLEERLSGFHQFVKARRKCGVWPYLRSLVSRPMDMASILDEQTNTVCRGINFGSQDYLGLAQDERVNEAVIQIIKNYGVHSAGSPTVTGRTPFLRSVEKKICQVLGLNTAVIYPTGWAAGFGILAGLARKQDTIVMDSLSHNCLQEGATHATNNVHKFKHNDTKDLRKLLSEQRILNPKNGLFVVFESLYSMDSDSPNLKKIVEICREFEAISIIDIAHDFGAMGEPGLGLLDTVEPSDWPDVIMGSFSKTFASTGGFIASNIDLKDFLHWYSPSLTFSNAMTPPQAAAVLAAMEICFSEEGRYLRQKLNSNIELLRREMLQRGFRIGGTPSAIVPVYVGDEKLARLTSSLLEHSGLIANLVEFPAVARGTARFRFQVMASHSKSAIKDAAKILANCCEKAQAEFGNMRTATVKMEVAATP